MKYTQAIRPISYLKAHASEIIRDISANQDTMIITHNGEAKVVVQDIRVFEETQESMAMLKMLAQSSANIKKDEYKPLDKAFSDLRKRIEDAQ